MILQFFLVQIVKEHFGCDARHRIDRVVGKSTIMGNHSVQVSALVAHLQSRMEEAGPNAISSPIDAKGRAAMKSLCQVSDGTASDLFESILLIDGMADWTFKHVCRPSVRSL